MPDEPSPPASIDAHVHVWRLEESSYSWLGPSTAAVHRNIELDELIPSLSLHGMQRVLLVQADDTREDTNNMLRVANEHPTRVAGIVGWLPLDDPQVAADTLHSWALDGRIVGMRSLIHDRFDPHWIIGPTTREGLTMLENAELPLDFVTSGPEALELLPALQHRHPRLRIVLDHLGKPPIGGGSSAIRRWRDLIAAAAASPRVSAKLSGLYQAGGHAQGWSVTEVRPFIEHAIEVFGPSRLMFGSDWPMSTMEGGYSRALEAVSGSIADLPSSDREAIMGGTAIQVYALDRPTSDAYALLSGR